jgi:hypothetical protein
MARAAASSKPAALGGDVKALSLAQSATAIIALTGEQAMARVLVRKLSDDVVARLKARAARGRRSLEQGCATSWSKRRGRGGTRSSRIWIASAR